MKKEMLNIVAATVLSICVADAAHADPDLAGRLRWLAPGKDADWSSAAGVEVQARFWQAQRVGFALAAGCDSWNAVNDVIDRSDEEAYLHTSVSGDAIVVPVGLSMLYRSSVMEDMDLMLELGFRYMFVDSSIYSEAIYQDDAESKSLAGTVSIENSLVAVVGLNLEMKANDQLSVELGISQQFDLGKPHEKFTGKDIGETSFQGTSFTIGVVMSF
jgi:hypothetical protein